MPSSAHRANQLCSCLLPIPRELARSIAPTVQAKATSPTGAYFTQGQELWCLLKADFNLSSYLPPQLQKVPTSRFLSSCPMPHGEPPASFHLWRVTHLLPGRLLPPGSWIDSEIRTAPVREAHRGHQRVGWSPSRTSSAGNTLCPQSHSSAMEVLKILRSIRCRLAMERG